LKITVFTNGKSITYRVSKNWWFLVTPVPHTDDAIRAIQKAIEMEKGVDEPITVYKINE
jgi:hypothetical protein